MQAALAFSRLTIPVSRCWLGLHYTQGFVVAALNISHLLYRMSTTADGETETYRDVPLLADNEHPLSQYRFELLTKARGEDVHTLKMVPIVSLKQHSHFILIA